MRLERWQRRKMPNPNGDSVFAPLIPNLVVGAFAFHWERELADTHDLLELVKRRAVAVPLRGRFDILPEAVAGGGSAVAGVEGVAREGELPTRLVIACEANLELYHASFIRS